MKHILKMLSIQAANLAIVAIVIASGCFVPAPGFRDDVKPSQMSGSGQKPKNTSQHGKAADTQQKNTSTPNAGSSKPAPDIDEKQGIYHIVKKGQTIYRISVTYGIPQDIIMAANGITDPTTLKVGQKLFIPGADREIDVPDPTPPSSTSSAPPDSPPPSSTGTSNGGKPPIKPEPLPVPTEPPPPEPKNSKCPPNTIKFIFPTEGKLSSKFGMRHGRHHDGIDILNDVGTPIYSAADGVVIYDGRLGGYGLLVIVKHVGDFKTIYAHNRENLVRKGETVRQGQKIAEMGASGNATAVHLHFEIRCGQDAVDPLYYLPEH